MDPGTPAWEVVSNVSCVVCPHCAFTFDAIHTDAGDETYTCPCCTGKVKAERDLMDPGGRTRWITRVDEERIVKALGQRRLAYRSIAEAVEVLAVERAESSLARLEALLADLEAWESACDRGVTVRPHELAPLLAKYRESRI